jgi:hypothetical protein
MVKIGGGGPKAPDTSGVQRAHEGVMREHARGGQQAAQLGQTTTQALGLIQRQGMHDEEMAARKRRLDVEMAKSDLEFRGEGAQQTVGVTEEGQERQIRAEERARMDSASKAQRAHAYELSQQMALVKAGYTQNGELTDAGQKALQNLSRDYKQRQAMFSRLANGDEAALKEFAASDEGKQAIGNAQVAQQLNQSAAGTGEPMAADPGAGTAGAAGIATQPGGAQGGQLEGLAMDFARAIPLVRAGLDFAQLKMVVNSKGEMPEDVMMDSPAWQQFNSARNNFIAIAKSGVMMPPQFKNIKERNRFFNELAAKQVLSGRPAPGSLAEPSMMGDTPPAAGPTADDGTPRQPAPNEQLGDVSVPPGTANPAAGPVPNAGGWGAQN